MKKLAWKIQYADQIKTLMLLSVHFNLNVFVEIGYDIWFRVRKHKNCNASIHNRLIFGESRNGRAVERESSWCTDANWSVPQYYRQQLVAGVCSERARGVRPSLYPHHTLRPSDPSHRSSRVDRPLKACQAVLPSPQSWAEMKRVESDRRLCWTTALFQ